MPSLHAERFDTLLFPRWIAPVEPVGTVLTDCALAISGDRIQAILPAAEARRLASVPDLRDSEAADGPGIAERVATILDSATEPPVVLVRRIQRLADALVLLTPRGRRT